MNTIYFVVIVAVLVSSAQSWKKGNTNLSDNFRSQGPPPCVHFECPKYTVLERGNNYELRKYEVTKWVMAHGVGSGDIDADVLKEAFKKLRGYINGKNSEKMKINITYPALVRIDLYNKIFEEKRLHLHFLLPRNIRDNPPKPLESGVYFVTQHARKRFVGSFDKQCTKYAEYHFHLEKLQQSLLEAGKRFHHDHFFYAQYYINDTSKVFYNEVWADQGDFGIFLLNKA